MKRTFLPHTYVSITFLVAFVFFFFNASLPFTDPDTPWHIAAGDLIINTHAIPDIDPWSYTAGEHTWYNISWLWDALLSIINTHFGLEGVYVFTVLMLSSILALLCHFLYQREGITEDPIKIAIALAGLALWDFTSPRPQLISFLFAIIFHHCLHRSRTNASGGLLFGLMPLLMVVWVNIHGGFLIAATLFFAYLIEAYMKKDFAWFKRIFISGFLCFLALFVNPWGWEMSIATYRTLHSVITSSIQEWHPFTYGFSLASSVLILSFILISHPSNKHVPIADKIITFGWLLASFNAFRNLAPFALLAAPYIAINLQHTITLKPLPDISGINYRLKLFAFAVIVIGILSLPAVSNFLRGKDFAHNDIKTPEKELAYIKEHYPDTLFLNHYNIGGMLIYYGGDSLKLFVDGRAGTAYPEELLEDYLDIMSLKEGGEELLDKYQVEGFILPLAHKKTNLLIEKHYQLKPIYEGDFAAIYLREKH